MMFPAGTLCPFALEVILTGKLKTIELPGDRLVATGPGLHTTMTNLDEPSQHATLSTAGTAHVTTQQGGSTVVVYTGRNVLFDEQEGALVLVIGTFTQILDAAGHQTFEGQGQLVNACELIA
jgi:hypothetical protein